MTFANPHDAADAVCSALGLDASKVAALTITLTPNRLAEVAVVQYLEQPDADGLAAVLRHYDLTEQVDAPMDDDDEDLIDTARAYHDLRDEARADVARQSMAEDDAHVECVVAVASLTAERDEAIRHKVELDDLRRQAKAERDEARAEAEAMRRGEVDGVFTSVVHECCERAIDAEAAVARVRALCDGEPEVTRWIDGQRLIDRDKVRAALDGGDDDE